MATINMPNNQKYPKAFHRLLKSYRSKIRRYVAPGTSFSLELVMGCSLDQLFKEVSSKLREGMTWDNYGEEWCFSNMESPKEYDLTDSEQFLSYFNYKSFAPVLNSQLEGIGARSKGWPVLRTGKPVNPKLSSDTEE